MNYYIVYKHGWNDSHLLSIVDSIYYSVVPVSKEDATMYALKGIYVYACQTNYIAIRGREELDVYSRLKQHYNVEWFALLPQVDFELL